VLKFPNAMIKALIVDDEEKAREVLQALIEMYIPEITIVETTGSPMEAVARIRQLQPDILFLDVVMPRMNGFDVLNTLDEWNFEVIFTTAYNDYAIQAIRFSALDYLLKPIDPDELRTAVDRFLEKRQTERKTLYQNLVHNLNASRSSDFRLAVTTTEGTFFYNTEEIIRCEADSNYTQFYLTQNRKFIASRTLKEYDEMLTEHGFLRVHKSHLVNLDFVEDYLGRGFVRLKDQTEIEVARRRREAVLEALQHKSHLS